jgi:hypothetical protein
MATKVTDPHDLLVHRRHVQNVEQAFKVLGETPQATTAPAGLSSGSDPLTIRDSRGLAPGSPTLMAKGRAAPWGLTPGLG